MMSVIWYIKIQVTSFSKTGGHVDFQLQSNVVHGIYARG